MLRCVRGKSWALRAASWDNEAMWVCQASGRMSGGRPGEARRRSSGALVRIPFFCFPFIELGQRCFLFPFLLPMNPLLGHVAHWNTQSPRFVSVGV